MPAKAKRWTLAIFGQAPMGPTETLVLIVTGGAVVLAVPLTSAIPTSDDPWPVWALWVVVVVAGVLLFLRGLVGVTALVASGVSEAQRATRRWRRRRTGKPLSHSGLDVLVTPGSGTGTMPQHSFNTGGRRHHRHDLGHFPITLEFSKPQQRIVRLADLPVRMKCGAGWITVEHFFDRGVVIDEDATEGDPVGFVSHPAPPLVVASPDPAQPTPSSPADPPGPFVDFVNRPEAGSVVKLDAFFGTMNAARRQRARIRAWVMLRAAGREPSEAALSRAAQTLYERNDTILDVTEDEIRAYLDAGGTIAPELLTWNALSPSSATISSQDPM